MLWRMRPCPQPSLRPQRIAQHSVFGNSRWCFATPSTRGAWARPCPNRQKGRSNVSASSRAAQQATGRSISVEAIAHPASAEPGRSAVKRYLPWIVATALFMEQLDATILNKAVPSIAAGLQMPALSLRAVVASCVLSLALGIPLSGWLAHRFGTRRVFAAAISLFTAASMLRGRSRRGCRF